MTSCIANESLIGWRNKGFFFRWLANLNMKRNLTSLFLNKYLPSTHLLFINSFSSWSDWRKQPVVDCRRKVTKWTGLIVLANHNRSRESNEPITILRAIAGSQLKARENNCKQFSFWLAKNMFSKMLNEQPIVTMQNSFRNYIWRHLNNAILRG